MCGAFEVPVTCGDDVVAPIDRKSHKLTPAEPAQQLVPPSLQFNRITTDAVTARDRFDCWRELFPGCHLDRLPGSDAWRDFHGEMAGCMDGNGTVFANLRNDPVLGTFGQRDSDLVLIGCIHRGAFRFSHGEETTILDARSGLVLFDCDRPVTSSASTVTEISYLALSRSTVTAAMGSNDIITRGAPVRFLPKDGLVPVMRKYLHALAKHGSGLDRSESAAAMKAATTLATVLFAKIGRKPVDEREEFADTVFEAARHHIELNYWRHDLTADRIASAVGCSRTHLYRLFSNRGQTVAGLLRDVRLQHARLLLETEWSQSIGLIAFNSGYSDLSAFGKAFRRLYGISPRDCRKMVPMRDMG